MRIEIAIVLLASAVDAAAAEHVVDQRDKRFNTTELKVKAGDTVKFVNSDSFFHNVFSLSDTKTFDLGSYPKGQSRSVKFDRPGEVDVECAIHPDMKLRIKVEK
jgi:plastocyanin